MRLLLASRLPIYSIVVLLPPGRHNKAQVYAVWMLTMKIFVLAAAGPQADAAGPSGSGGHCQPQRFA